MRKFWELEFEVVDRFVVSALLCFSLVECGSKSDVQTSRARISVRMRMADGMTNIAEESE